MAAVSGHDDLRAATGLIESHQLEMQQVLKELHGTSLTDAQLRPIRQLTDRLLGALHDLEARVGERMKIEEQKLAAIEEINDARDRLMSWLEPEIDDANFELVMQAEEATEHLAVSSRRSR